MTEANKGHSDGGNGRRDAGLSAQYEALLDAYLDGRLSEADAAVVRRRAAVDPVLGRELELQAKIDSSIKRTFVVPVGPAAPGESVAIPPASIPISRGAKRRRGPMVWGLAAAAAIVLAIGGYWAVVGSPLGDPSHVSAQVAYKGAVDAGFTPKWVCKDAQEFAQYTKDRLGAAWTMPVEPGLTLVGWRYCENVLGPDADMLLATSGDAKIVVLADRKANARKLRDGGGLHVFTREMGDVVMYEISPLEKPMVISAVRTCK